MPKGRWSLLRIIPLMVGLMSGVLSIAREFLLFVAPTTFHEAPLFWASMRIAFVVSAIIAWTIEHREKQSLRAELTELQKKYSDNAPQLDLMVACVEGIEEWGKQQEPVTFWIRTLGGRPARDIRFDCLESKRGNYRLDFESIAALGGQVVQLRVPYELSELVGKPIAPADLQALKRYDGIMLRLFVEDADMQDLQIVEYPLTARFMDGDDERSYTFCLRFDPYRFTFLRNTAAAL